MKSLQHLASRIDLNLSTFDIIIYAIIGLTAYLLPPILILIGLYWVMRGDGIPSKSAVGTCLIGAVIVGAGVLVYIIANQYTSLAAFYAFGPMLALVGAIHKRLMRKWTPVGILLVGVGAAIFIISLYTLTYIL